MKTDARARYTRTVIRESFLALLKEQPLNKVTVTDICRRAEINRATFYRHYADPYALLEQIEEELLEELRGLLSRAGPGDLRRTLETVLGSMRANGPLYTTLFSERGDGAFPLKVFRTAYRAVAPETERRFRARTAGEREWVYCFLAQGCSGVLHRWVRGGMTEPPEAVAAFLEGLCTSASDALAADRAPGYRLESEGAR